MTRSNEEEASVYARWAGFAGDWRDTWWNDDFLLLMASRLGLFGARRMLDVGCGVGHWGQRWARLLPELEVVGVDREVDFLPQATKRAERLGLSARCQAVEGHGEALPFDDASFDVVTCQTVLIHAASADEVVAEMIRVCRPGGLVVVAEPDNWVNVAAGADWAPERTLEERLELLRFAEITQRGKLLSGHGDERVGGRLPQLLHGAGLEVVGVWSNDQTAWRLPGVSTSAQKLEDEQVLGQGEVVSSAGGHDQARARFLAGGGSAEDFDRVWALVERNDRQYKAHVKAGTLAGSRAFVHVLGVGRRGPPPSSDKILFHATGWQAEVEWKEGIGERSPARVVLNGFSTGAVRVDRVVLRFDGASPTTLDGETLTVHFVPGRFQAVLAAMERQVVVVHGHLGVLTPFVVVQCGDIAIPMPE